MHAPIVIMSRYAGERQSGDIMTVRKGKTIQTVWFNGREYRRIIWHRSRVVLTFCVHEHVNADMMFAYFIGRRKI